MSWLVEISPSEETVRAIEEGFYFTPRGLEVAHWPEGRFRQARVDIHAEPGYLMCQFESEVGGRFGDVGGARLSGA